MNCTAKFDASAIRAAVLYEIKAGISPNRDLSRAVDLAIEKTIKAKICEIETQLKALTEARKKGDVDQKYYSGYKNALEWVLYGE